MTNYDENEDKRAAILAAIKNLEATKAQKEQEQEKYIIVKNNAIEVNNTSEGYTQPSLSQASNVLANIEICGDSFDKGSFSEVCGQLAGYCGNFNQIINVCIKHIQALQADIEEINRQLAELYAML